MKGRIAKKYGFSLLEVLVALIILAVGLLGLAALQITAIRFNAGSRELTYATFLLQKKIEELKALPFDDSNLTESHTQVFINEEEGGYRMPYLVTWNVTENAPDEGFKKVLVQVSWNATGLGGSQSVPRTVNATIILGGK